MAEQMIEANGVPVCTEPFGDPADPAILLVVAAILEHSRVVQSG